jgi:hypothetical protein
MSDELEAFLRRAAQKRQKRRPAEIVLIEPGDEPVVAEPVPEPRRRPSRPPQYRGASTAPPAPPAQPPPPVRAPLRYAEGPLSGPGSTALEIAESLRPENVNRLADHQLGHLQRSAESIAVDHADERPRVLASNIAAEIFELLRTPGGGRQAILLQEILTPPTQRWQ